MRKRQKGDKRHLSNSSRREVRPDPSLQGWDSSRTSSIKMSRDFPGGVVLWLRLCAANAGGVGSILVRELRSHKLSSLTRRLKKKKKIEEKKEKNKRCKTVQGVGMLY